MTRAPAVRGIKRAKANLLPSISEHALQTAVADYLAAVIRPPMYWTSLDHAGKLEPRQAAMRKRRGVKKGIADIMIVAPGPRLLFLELKRPGARQSPEQAVFERAMADCGAWYVVCNSVEGVQKALAFLGIVKPRPAWPV